MCQKSATRQLLTVLHNVALMHANLKVSAHLLSGFEWTDVQCKVLELQVNPVITGDLVFTA